jgi:hypothetical protein
MKIASGKNHFTEIAIVYLTLEKKIQLNKWN